jgi:tRNA pseudouridine(38-40) synthase
MCSTANFRRKELVTRSWQDDNHFLDDRDWDAIRNFYQSAIFDPSLLPVDSPGSTDAAWRGTSPISKAAVSYQSFNGSRHDGSTAQNKRVIQGGKRTTFLIEVNYDGGAFFGVSSSAGPGRPTVIGEIRRALIPLFPPPPGSGDDPAAGVPAVVAAARTDAGVHAVGQVLSLHTRAPVTAAGIRAALDSAAARGSGDPDAGVDRNGSVGGPARWSVRDVRGVDRSFHAAFSATGRRYLYLLPLRAAGPDAAAAAGDEEDVDVEELRRQLRGVTGRPLSFAALCTRPPPGPAGTVCRISHSDARRVDLILPAAGGGISPGVLRAVAVEVEADRFVRRMVRTLVAAAVLLARRGGGGAGGGGACLGDEEAGPGAGLGGLAGILAAGRRPDVAPAPACGLCLVGVRYAAFDAGAGGAAVRAPGG